MAVGQGLQTFVTKVEASLKYAALGTTGSD
jgi:hypothetical protein